ncbi:MAG: tRNA pseudouridine(13) synthase TruD [Polyangiaceae bacterium]|nr:tRNA pseudouridine(13) synthase TruD [Polyangiaceae bacterium]
MTLHRVHEPPLSAAALPAVGGAIGPAPEDFVVDEILDFAPEGCGEHLWVRIEKRLLNTQDAIEIVARASGVRARDIGSAGMKDKHAITTQWLSLPGSASAPDTWQLPDSVRVVESVRHPRKLRTGQLAGNRFTIRLVGVPEGGADRAAPIAARLREHGLPNHFGAQRFGIGGANLGRALEWLATGARADRKRGRFYTKLYPSVIQSEIFNRYLTSRSELGLGQLLAGDVVRLDGSGSVFVVEDPAREQPRFDARDLHLTGPMPGPKMRRAAGLPLELEQRAATEAGIAPELIEALGRFVDGTRRDLVVFPGDLTVSAPAPGELVLSFFLPAGSYATELVRELTRAPFFGPRERGAPPAALADPRSRAMVTAAMSRFDMTAAHDLPPPKLEALIETMFLAASSDGEFSEEEQAHFKKSLESLTSARLSNDELDALLARAKTDLDAQGREARLNAVKARLPEPGVRKVALALAIQVTAADGIIRTSERELIFETAEALEVDRDEAADLVKNLAPG